MLYFRGAAAESIGGGGSSTRDSPWSDLKEDGTFMKHLRFDHRGVEPVRALACLLVVLGTLVSAGCWAPFRSPGIPACSLPDEYRMPYRSAAIPINYAKLTVQPPSDYLLGPGDILEVTVAGLYPGAEVRPLQVQVMGNGEINLPLVGAVNVEKANLAWARQRITQAYANGFLKSPAVNVALMQKSTISVLVLGQVANAGVHELPKYENDVGHAVAAAGGLTRDAAEMIEVHRRMARPVEGMPQPQQFPGPGTSLRTDDPSMEVRRIALREVVPDKLTAEDVLLNAGDVVIVPDRRNEVFFVVGKLSSSNLVRFTVGDRERELGVGFELPPDRDIDVVTAVTMAGYIDPIDSPTTVTVHRRMPDGTSMLILVDLIKARYDPRETINVQPGDIIYLNPDAQWYFRRTFDRVIESLIIVPYTLGVNW